MFGSKRCPKILYTILRYLLLLLLAWYDGKQRQALGRGGERIDGEQVDLKRADLMQSMGPLYFCVVGSAY